MSEKLVKGTGLASAVLAFLLSLPAYAAEINLQPPQNGIAREVYDLHLAILLVCLLIFIVVFGAMFWSILKHRKSLGHEAAHFHENTTVEILWTLIPFLILLGMVYPASKTVLAMKDTSEPALTLKITGYQWKWEYTYLNQGVDFFSQLTTPYDQIHGQAARDPNYLLEVDKPLVVPTGENIRVLITAADVIHGWLVPSLAVQQDAIPGQLTDFWFEVDKPGTYRGQCAQICGKEHGFMPIVVIAKTPDQFQAWLKAEQAREAAATLDPNKVYTKDELIQHGEAVYKANCAACHQANGHGIPGTFPSLAGS